MKKIDLLTQPHKDQRKWMYSLSIKAGSLDFNDKNMLESFNLEFKSLIKDVEEHSENEEMFILPLLEKQFPNEVFLFKQDHPKNEEYLHTLIKQLKELNQSTPEERPQLGLTFYRIFNKFIGEYLLHINKEEEMILPTLDQHFSAENLLGVLIAFITFRQGNDPKKVKNFIESMTEPLTLNELKALFTSMKTYAPAHIFQSVCYFSKEVLNSNRWLHLEKEVLSVSE